MSGCTAAKERDRDDVIVQVLCRVLDTSVLVKWAKLRITLEEILRQALPLTPKVMVDTGMRVPLRSSRVKGLLF
jgi:hypothetical protein